MVSTWNFQAPIQACIWTSSDFRMWHFESPYPCFMVAISYLISEDIARIQIGTSKSSNRYVSQQEWYLEPCHFLIWRHLQHRTFEKLWIYVERRRMLWKKEWGLSADGSDPITNVYLMCHTVTPLAKIFTPVPIIEDQMTNKKPKRGKSRWNQRASAVQCGA